MLKFLLAFAFVPGLILAREWPDSRVMTDLIRHSAAETLSGSTFHDWAVFSSSAIEKPVLSYGRPLSVDADNPAGDGLRMVLDAVRSHARFELVSNRAAGNLTRVCYREMYQDLPVLCGRADLVFNARTELMRWSLRDYSMWPARGRHVLSVPASASSVVQHLKVGAWRVEKSLAAWLPDLDERVLLPVYWIWLSGSLPDERWQAIVNAESGEILHQWPGIQTDVVSAVVRGSYWQPYDQSEVQIGVHAFESVLVNDQPLVTSPEGEFSQEVGNNAQLSTTLHGLYVDVQNEDAPRGQMTLALNAPFTEFNWDWQVGDASRPELNLYHHEEFIHEYYKLLDPDFSALDYPVPAVANVGNNYDNAYWNGFGTYFGSGSQYLNFAMFSDVIYHEYTHGVTDGIYPDGMLPYDGQSGAMNEAWSDYIACSINGDPLMGDRMLGGNPFSAFRDLESNLVFPQNWVGEVHGDSPFISAPLWTIRAAVGVALGDSLAHFARYALAETFFDYLVAVLETDDNDGDLSNGTPHDAIIYGAFGDHGIGPGDDPHFELTDLSLHADGEGQSIGDGDRFMEQGETAELTFTLHNDAPLFPPPATNVQITISTNDPDVSITNGNQFTASLPAGAAFELSPVLMQMNSAAPDHWVTVNIDVICNGGSITFQHPLEFTLGTPHLLIVKDDPTSDVEHFVTSLVRSQNMIFDAVDLGESEDLPADHYLGYGMVIWLSGNASGNVLTSQDESWLTTFVQGGNKIVLSGQDIADNLGGSDFAENVLQVQISPDSVRSHAVTMTASPFEPESWYLTTGTDGAANQRTQTSFLPFGSSSQVCYFGRTGSGPISGVSFSGGNGLLFGFGIEAISGMSGSASLADFMNHLYAWAGSLLGNVPDASPAALPALYGITSAYPNPFNSNTRIQYSIPGGVAQILIFDLLGRMVERYSLPGSEGSFEWSPQQASGIYFAQIRWVGGQSEPVKLLQIR
jgi:hypothetical protein